jgi:dTDP-glucose 4,6-dehydratase
MRIIVTGGAGFIGSAVCRYLVAEQGAQVLNIDKLTYAANPMSLDPIAGRDEYTFAKADICDSEAMRRLFMDFKPDAVIHLAAESHVDRSITDSGTFVETNINGTFILLEAARSYWSQLSSERQDAFRFVHVSTDEVYGSLGEEGLFEETTAYDPSSPYAASKAASDHLALAWHRTYGLPVLISNCSNNYGPHQFPEKLIPLMILNARDGKPLPVYGDGSNVRDWLYVDDHVRAIFLVLRKGTPGEKYNVGGRNELTNLTVIQRLCEFMDRHHPDGAPHERLIEFVDDRLGHDHRYAIDARKIEHKLGWRAAETFETGLEKTVCWYLENEAWWGSLRQTVYSGERLGLIAGPAKSQGG